MDPGPDQREGDLPKVVIGSRRVLSRLSVLRSNPPPPPPPPPRSA